MAKIYGGYQKLHNEGTVEDYIKILTGAPIISIKTNDYSKIKRIVLSDYFSQEERL